MKKTALLLMFCIGFFNVQAAPLADLSGGQSGRIEFQSITPQSIWTYARRNLTDTKNVVVWGDLLMPKNATNKVPALVLSHGSSGVSPYAYDVWASKMNAAGVAIFIVFEPVKICRHTPPLHATSVNCAIDKDRTLPHNARPWKPGNSFCGTA